MPTANRASIRPTLYTVPFGTDLCEATASLVLEKCSNDPLQVSAATLLLPNNRAIKALTDAFVRQARPGLLLPRMAAIGDLALEEALGPLLDPLADDACVLPAISPAARMLLLAQLVTKHRPAGQSISPAEALRLARHLAEMIDELEIEQVGLDAFADISIEADLQSHWQSSYGQLLRILPDYRQALAAKALLGPSERRNILLDWLSTRLRANPPQDLFIAAGITTSAKAVARVLSHVAKLPQGMVILPGVDLDMPESLWEALGPHPKAEGDAKPRRSHETHPQFHLKLLLERMSMRREEIAPILAITPSASQRATVITDIFCLPEQSANWGALPPKRKQLADVAVLEASDSAEEARAIAIKARAALETPGLRIAVITPDRELAVRVAAQLRRWDIMVDDSAGTPLLQTPNGTLILALAEAFANRFSPVSLLAIAKHPQVHAGEERLVWLEMARKLDLRLRGPATGVGLRAVTKILAEERKPDEELMAYWGAFQTVLSSLENANGKPFADIMTAIQDIAGKLTENGIWKGATGRQFATLWEEFSGCDLSAIGPVERNSVPAILSELFGRAVVRPPYGGHPRAAIYGLLEARMQQADLMICGGLNEGNWPQLPQPDPWLAPAIRRHLGLATLDRNIGLSAHDLSTTLGGKQVLLTRAKRDRSGPTVASRFLLRIKALLGDQLDIEQQAAALASRIDQPSERVRFATRPEPVPSAEQRHVALSITDFDQLKSDPYSFYAKRILGLRVLEPVDAEPSYAWRGTLVHDILEKWFIEDHCDPERLIERAEALLTNETLDPLLRALWQPRMAAGLRWIAEETRRLQDDEGRQLLVAERSGSTELLGVKIKGRADRIDRLADGSLAIIDYKTGAAPKAKQATAGFAMQLGLVGLMADQGRIKDVTGAAGRFEYWSLAKSNGEFGHISRPTSKKVGDGNIEASDFVEFVRTQAEEALAKWIIGTAPFAAKLHPEYANYEDYNQLMRLQEWDGRQPVGDVEIG
ncbi:MAG: double-strand break repair protein AddB [Sphingorhabdus sp.]